MDSKASRSDLVLILNYSSQHAHLITHRIRSFGVFSLCIPGTSPLETVMELSPLVVVLSGGQHSVHTPESPRLPDGFVEWTESNGVFVLGIGYGLLLVVQELGGEVRVGKKQEYGTMEMEVGQSVGIFENKSVGDKQFVWMSHGEEVARLPEGFEIVGRCQQGAVAAVQSPDRRFYGLQYHPGVSMDFSSLSLSK